MSISIENPNYYTIIFFIIIYLLIVKLFKIYFLKDEILKPINSNEEQTNNIQEQTNIIQEQTNTNLDKILPNHKNEVIYLLLMTLNYPIIGIKNYSKYKEYTGPYVPPVYNKVTVLKYGKVISSDIYKRINQEKKEYNANNVKILFLAKSNDLNVISTSDLEKTFKNYINNTDNKLKIVPRNRYGIYKSKVSQEFMAVCSSSVLKFRKFFSKYSKIVYDPYKLLDLELSSFDDFIDSKINDTYLVLNSNINNITVREQKYIKQYHNNNVILYDTSKIDYFKKLIH